ncbi:MAG TPA: CAP domain-containing protein [Actinomycetota bacterium]|nr:CAP domain-containing protein [Actinomycetota bacterium]
MPMARALPGKRLTWALVALLAAAALLTPSGLHDASANSPKYRYRAAEKCFMRKVNRARAAHGQRRLNWDKHLGYVARRHANTMANQGGVWHDQNLGHRVTRWRSLGQNTGAGGKCRKLFRSFMSSAPHRANILGRWRFIGVGTQWKGNRLYVQTVFESKRNPGNVWSWP